MWTDTHIYTINTKNTAVKNTCIYVLFFSFCYSKIQKCVVILRHVVAVVVDRQILSLKEKKEW